MQRITRATKHLAVLSLWLAGAIVGASIAGAQSGGGYDLTWNSLDNGGAVSSGGAAPNNYELAGTAGQPDAGAMSGGAGNSAYTLNGGFWVPPAFRALVPIVRKP